MGLGPNPGQGTAIHKSAECGVRIIVNPLMLIIVSRMDHKLLDTASLTSGTQNDQKVSSTVKTIQWHFSRHDLLAWNWSQFLTILLDYISYIIFILSILIVSAINRQ